MTNSFHFARKSLRGGSALRALALLGAGLTASAMFAAPVAAQDYTNVTASGKVQGTNGTPLAGATVTITSDDQGFTRTATTDSSGGFRIPQIRAGAYTFTIAAPGYDTYTEAGVRLDQTSAGNQFTLSPTGSAAAGADGEIIVTAAGRARVADFESNTTGAVISIGELATRVPVARSLRDIILLAPGTTQGGSAQNARFAGQAQISGSSFTENAYYINGLNVTEFRQGFSPVTVPFDFYETAEVKTGGFQAEFGRATGGVVNAITKSGSNDFHGSILFNWEPDDLREDQPNTYLADNDGDKANRLEMIAQLSGPIIKDKLFFYALYNFRDVSSFNGGDSARIGAARNPAGNTAVYSRTTSPFWGAKLDATPFDGQRLEFTYFDSTGEELRDSYRYNSDTNAVGAFTGRSRTLYGGENYVGRYTGTFAKWLTVSGAYGKNKNRAATLPADTTRPRVIDARGTPFAIPGTNPNGNFTTNDDVREFYRGDVDLYFQLLGSHHVRFGYDREDLRSVARTSPTGDGFYQIFRSKGAGDRANLPAGSEYFERRFFDNGGSFKSRNEAYYIQDNWQLFDNRLTLQLGIRNDRFDTKNAGGQTFYASGNQWGPRLGASFDVFGDGRSKIFGSFGRYFVPVVANTNIRLAGNELDYREYFRFVGLDANGVPIEGAPVTTINNARPCLPQSGSTLSNCTITADGKASDPTTLVARNLKSQYVDEYIVGAETRYGDRWRFGIEGTYRKLGRALEDAAIDQAAIAYCTSQGFSTAACTGIFSGFHQYVLINPGLPQTIVLSGFPNGTTPTVNFTTAQLGYPKAVRDYYAVTFKADREFDGVWSLSASYTWSDLKGNYEGGAKSDIGQTDTGLTQDFDQPGFTIGSYGFLPGHRRHTFKLYGSVRPVEWLDIGFNGLLSSPKKFGCIGVVPTSVDPFAELYGAAGNFCQGKRVDRGTVFQSDWRKEVNLSFTFRVPADFDASVRFDVFNVFNSKSALDFNEFGDLDNGAIDPDYRKPLVYQDARSARIQLRVGF